MISLKIALKAEVSSRVGASEALRTPGDAVLVVRGAPRWLLICCPCGCGEEIPVNLDARSGKAWRLYRSASTGITLFPSVWRDTGCQSHFIVWHGRILLFGNPSAETEQVGFENDELAQRVINIWPKTGFASYVQVADSLGEIPWDVLEACRLLVKKCVLVEGVGAQQGWYRRTGK